MSTQDNWSGEGYDAEASSGNSGIYFRLKEKNQKARLRLVSAAYRFFDKLPDGKEIRKCAWIAILKEQVNEKIEKRVVCFQSGPMVYGLIKDLTESSDWGDPQEFDITVERTEEQGKYYTVLPHPKPMGPISEDDKALIKEANLDLFDLCKPKAATQGSANTPPEFDPYE